jgi:HK97 family phage portal protein
MTIIRKAYDWVGSALGFNSEPVGTLGMYLNPVGYSGRIVTPDSSLQTIAVLRCATLLAGAGASLPIDVFTRSGAMRQSVENHPAEYLLDSTPNEDMTSMDFRAAMWMSFLLWGNAYARIVWSGDGKQRPIGLYWLPPNPECMQVRRRDNGRLIYLYTPPGATVPVPYEPRDILHVKWFSNDGGITGMSPIAQARQAIARSQDAEEYGARFFGNGAKPSIAIEYPTKLSDAAIKNLRESFERQYGGVENAHRVAVFEGGAKISPFSINPADAQFLEQEQYGDERIAMLYGIPPHMLGLVSKTTSWGSGIAEQKLGMLTFTLEPLLVIHEKSYERSLLRDDERRVSIKHNLNAFMRTDIKTRFEAYAIGVDKGILTRDECRALEDLNPRGVNADVLTVQSQMIPLDMAGKITKPSQQQQEASNDRI